MGMTSSYTPRFDGETGKRKGRGMFPTRGQTRVYTLTEQVCRLPDGKVEFVTVKGIHHGHSVCRGTIKVYGRKLTVQRIGGTAWKIVGQI